MRDSVTNIVLLTPQPPPLSAQYHIITLYYYLV